MVRNPSQYVPECGAYEATYGSGAPGVPVASGPFDQFEVFQSDEDRFALGTSPLAAGRLSLLGVLEARAAA